MFSQVESALERSRGGLGIGLALVRGLVEMHGGSVEAQSAGLGEGSEFVVRLPIEKSTRHSGLAEGNDAAGEPRSGCRILLVDDNRDAVRLLAKALQTLGHDVATAFDGVEAVQSAESMRPHLILLDIGMPRMDGYEAARRIRASAAGRDAYLVAVTGWGQEQDKRRAREAGFDRHETKPISVETVQALVDAIRAR
jgi:CheY-like chemotaxis protein